jgi:hypothetical protein
MFLWHTVTLRQIPVTDFVVNTVELVWINRILGYLTTMFQLQAFYSVNREICFIINCLCFSFVPITVSAQFKARILLARSSAGTVGSNPAQFVPPCYSDWTIPALICRVKWIICKPSDDCLYDRHMCWLNERIKSTKPLIFWLVLIFCHV